MIVRPKVERYAEEHSSAEPPWLAALARETVAETDLPQMMVGRMQGWLLRFLVFALRPRLVVEIGAFTGYSALAMASELPEGGRIVTYEVDPRHAAIARRHVATSPWADRITLVEGKAEDHLPSLEGPFDLVFVDADKTQYGAYLDAVVPKLSPGGLLAVDNVLQFGGVVSEHDDSPDIVALREFNERVARDERVEQVVLTVREGITLVRRAP